jgi:periplasmic glucans biosynthesis protein
MTPSRRELLAGLLQALAAGATGVRPLAADTPSAGPRLGPPEPFSPALVVERARALAAAPMGPPDPALPEALAALDEARYQAIRFRPELALWRGLNLNAEAQFFHLGHRFRMPVRIYEVADGAAREVLYDPGLFAFGVEGFAAELPEDLGFAGFRLHAPLNRPDYPDEVVVFLGASYFRAVGRNQRYGIWARGVAIDTGLPKTEEFPAFRGFWLERPEPGAEQLVVYALLDGPSVSGAYTFRVRPGNMTTIEVEATLFAREAIELLGVAPLTSMFLFGPNDRRGIDDIRPSVHSSDGLQIWSGADEWLWRPLVNPEQLRLSLFSDSGIKGFGLLQRARDFAAYQDLEARYDRRPSLWVEPLEAWGDGHVRLIEIPSPSEIYDNVVAFWVPKDPVQAGAERVLRYRLYWCEAPPSAPDLGQTVGTRIGRGGGGDLQAESDLRRFLIDFAGGQLEDIPADAPVAVEVSVFAGQVLDPRVRKNEITGGWRVAFDLRPDGDGPVELRCLLRLEGRTLTETWVYQWTP